MMTGDKQFDLTIYVAPNGKDHWSGLYEKPLPDYSDGPLQSLEGAKNKVRRLTEKQIRVLIRQGEYFMDRTVVFTLEDTKEDGSVTYEAYPGENPVFTSGLHLNKWVRCEGPVEGLPDHAIGHVYRHAIPRQLDTVLTLFDGNRQLIRSHGPFFMPSVQHEYERVDSQNVAKEEDRSLLRRVDFEEGQLKDWPNIQDLELRFMPVPWTMNLLPLESVDVENNTAWLAVEATAPLCAKSRGMRIENVIDYLDEPGRWCVNTQEGVIYYWPLDEKPSDRIFIPGLIEYIRVEGILDDHGDEDRPVENLHFYGLGFKYGKVDRTSKGYKGSGIQHDWEMHDKATAIFRFRGAKNCSLRACHFHATSGGAIRLDLYCQQIVIEDNLIDQIGAMGILLCGYGPGTKHVNRKNVIRNNIVSRCGEEIWHGHGIFLWQSGENIIEHNRIHHSARKAIGLCGVRVTILRNPSHTFDEAVRTVRWDEINNQIDWNLPEDKRYLPFLHTRDNVVQYNEIYKVLQKIGDGSALNISGAGEGNLIRYNYLHHISTHQASGVMRVDDWQRGTTFKSNLIYKSNISGIIRKNYNHIIGNVMIDCNGVNGYIKFASYPGEKQAFGSRIEKNVFYDSGEKARFFGKGYLVSEEATLPENCRISRNVYYVEKEKDNGVAHLKLYQPMSLETDSIVADPLFEDVSAQKFRFSDASPVHALGIEQLPLERMGITSQYPADLLACSYDEEDLSEYDRGAKEGVTSYEWW